VEGGEQVEGRGEKGRSPRSWAHDLGGEAAAPDGGMGEGGRRRR
jgi:hypothetical protein